MPDERPPSKEEFLIPRSRYYGDFNPSELVFNDNLQEFAAQVGYICSLETGGKISGAEAYDSIKSLWKELKKSKKSLKVGDSEASSE